MIDSRYMEQARAEEIYKQLVYDPFGLHPILINVYLAISTPFVAPVMTRLAV